MHIDAAFDSGNIEVLDASDPHNIRLQIRPDPTTDTPDGPVRFFQWFHFCVRGARDVALTLHVERAAHAAYPDGWTGYRACVCDDGETWRRTDTSYDGQRLTIHVTPATDHLRVAYFAPYPLTRVADTTAWASTHPEVRVHPVATSLDGRILDRIVVGDDPKRPQIWVIARQHPGESMASWWMEGFLERLLDDADPLAVWLRRRAVFHVVPHMNPDGSFRGHLRTNATGANLNREWANPSIERSPEVLGVRDAMDTTGVHLCLDVHGDEALPYTFIAGPEGIPSWTHRIGDLLQRFKDAYERANPAFQQVHGYPPDAPGEANLTMCTAGVAQRFGCLAMTLEMPFKDDANHPDPDHGWSPARCHSMGRAALDPFAAVVDDLRI